MGVVISQQLAAFLAAGLLGAMLGLLYDLLRPIRRLLGGRPLWAADLFYCAVIAVSGFYYVMTFGGGELRIYMVLGGLGGAVLFFCLLSELLRPLWDFWFSCFWALLSLLLAPIRLFLQLCKKIRLLFKKAFSFLRKWFTIMARKWSIICFRRGGRHRERSPDTKTKNNGANHRSYSAGTTLRHRAAALPDAGPTAGGPG